jgi:hypothetical protein
VFRTHQVICVSFDISPLTTLVVLEALRWSVHRITSRVAASKLSSFIFLKIGRIVPRAIFTFIDTPFIRIWSACSLGAQTAAFID